MQQLKTILPKSKKAALVFRALNHKLRQEMLQFISEKSRVTVSEVYRELKLEQFVASQHLAILRNAGIVTTERDGKFIYYSVNENRLQEIDQVAGLLID